MIKVTRYLTSSVFSVVVGTKPTTYILHADLLAKESDRFSKSVGGVFSEATTKTITLDEEDPELFGFFVEYLYKGEGLMTLAVKDASECSIIARLYALGDRLQAPRFQLAVLRRFLDVFPFHIQMGNMSTHQICDLLEVACAELPEKVDEDKLRKTIFDFAAWRLADLQSDARFGPLLDKYSDLGKYLCLRAGRGQLPVVQRPEAPSARFAREGSGSIN